MPRIVAALYWPFVRNLPFPSPQSLRVFGFLAAALAFLAAGHGASGSLSVSVVMSPDCVTLNMPS